MNLKEFRTLLEREAANATEEIDIVVLLSDEYVEVRSIEYDPYEETLYIEADV